MSNWNVLVYDLDDGERVPIKFDVGDTVDEICKHYRIHFSLLKFLNPHIEEDIQVRFPLTEIFCDKK